MTIAMSQESKRYRKAYGKPTKLGHTSIVLGREIAKNEYKYIDSISTESLNDLYLELPDMQEGQYMVCSFL